VDALRLLFGHFLKLPWAVGFDWDRWSCGAQVLGRDHVTLARTYEQIDKAVADPQNLLGKRFSDIYRKCLAAMCLPDYTANTEKSYLGWINRFLRFHHGRHPCECTESEVASFLEYLAVKRKVSGATQRQALNALVFFYSRVLEQPLDNIGPFERPKKPKRLPTVLSQGEVQSLFSHLDGMRGLMVRLLYGTGMHVMECVRLGILDLDFDYRQIMVRASKGKKERAVPMPEKLLGDLQRQRLFVRQLHARD